MKKLSKRRISLPPVNPGVLYLGNEGEFDDFEYPSMTERGRSVFASFMKKSKTAERVRKIAAPLLVSPSIRPKVKKIVPKTRKKKIFVRKSMKVDNVVARLYNPQEGGKKKIKLKMSNSMFFSKTSRFVNRKQMKMTTSAIGKRNTSRSLPDIRNTTSRVCGKPSTPKISERRRASISISQGRGIIDSTIQGVGCLSRRTQKFKRELKRRPLKITKRIKSPNFSYPSLFYTPIRLEFPKGYHFGPVITHSERILKEAVSKISSIYEARFLSYFKGTETKKTGILRTEKFDETTIQNLDFANYQHSYRSLRFPRTINRVTSIPHREVRRNVQKKLSELRLESFIFKSKKRINCSNLKKYTRLHLEIASLQESLGSFEEANATYERVLVFLSEHSHATSVFTAKTVRRLNQVIYNRIGVNYMLLFLFEEQNVEQRQHFYINASYYQKVCLQRYLLTDDDAKIRSASLTNLGLINIYMGDDLRAARFFRECLGYPFIKKTDSGFHPEDDRIVGTDQLVALSNLLVTMLSSGGGGGEDVGVEILSQNMFLDVTCLAKNRVSSIIYMLLNSLSCLFQKDIVGGEKKLKKAREMLKTSDPSFLHSFVKEISQSFVILK